MMAPKLSRVGKSFTHKCRSIRCLLTAQSRFIPTGSAKEKMKWNLSDKRLNSPYLLKVWTARSSNTMKRWLTCYLDHIAPDNHNGPVPNDVKSYKWLAEGAELQMVANIWLYQTTTSSVLKETHEFKEIIGVCLFSVSCWQSPSLSLVLRGWIKWTVMNVQVNLSVCKPVRRPTDTHSHTHTSATLNVPTGSFVLLPFNIIQTNKQQFLCTVDVLSTANILQGAVNGIYSWKITKLISGGWLLYCLHMLIDE